MFKRTRIKLTAWYLLIIMIISLIFSLMIYSLVNVEFVRFEKSQARIQRDMDQGFYVQGPKPNKFEFESIEEARHRLVLNLGLLNLGILIFAGGAGYFLAGRTLKPIKEAMDEQNRFVSDSSHELRTPLTALRTEIEVTLMNKKLTLPQAKTALKSSLDEVVNLQLLSDKLLELAIREEQLNEYTFELVEIKEIVDISIAKTKNLAQNKNIRIKNNIKRKELEADPKKLTELFVILIENAIKYSTKKGNITIDSKKTRNHIKISVKDNGMGISKEDQDHIFDRFYRAEKSRTENGFGLGLSIAKKITEDHGGSIKVKSQTKKGTTFEVTLPV